MTDRDMNKSRNTLLDNIVLTKVSGFFEEKLKFNRQEATEMIQTLVKNRQFKFENRESVESILEIHSSSKEPFSECSNDSVNRTYNSLDRHIAESSYLNIFTNLLVRWLPGEANIRSKAPSNLPIHF